MKVFARCFVVAALLAGCSTHGSSADFVGKPAPFARFMKADGSYLVTDDLKGKNLGLVDPNSTSGNNVPRFEMNKMGIKPEEFFANPKSERAKDFLAKILH